MNSFIRFFLLLAFAARLSAAQQTINTGTNPNDGAGDSLRTAFAKVNANFTDLYSTGVFTNSTFPWSSITNTPVTLAGYGITNGVSYIYAAANYAPISSPTFTGTVTIPGGASISGYLTTAAAASTYAPLASPGLTGTPLTPTASVDTSTTQIASTAFVVGQAASATPLIDGTAAAGTSTRYARGDHVHPTDTSRAPLASPTFTGTVTIPGGASISGFAPLASPALTSVPTAPTAAVDTSTTQLATTAYVVNQGYLKSATAASTYATIANPSHTGGMTITYGTAATALSPLTITQTWNGSGIVFPGIVFNATDTLSAAGTLFLDLQISGSSKLSFQKTGKIVGNGANPYLYLDNAAGSQLGYGTGILNNGGNSLTWAVGGTEVARVDNAGLFSVASGGGYQWSSTTASSGAKDIILLRDAANTLAQRNGSNAQSYRLYNTYTDASNYERGVLDWATTANTLTIGSAKAGTGSSRAVNFIVGGVTALTLGTAGDVQLPKTITAAGTTGAQTINKATGSVNFAAAATSLVVTDSLVTTSSLIFPSLGTVDATAALGAVIPASGSFTINMKVAPTAETRVNFIITN